MYVPILCCNALQTLSRLFVCPVRVSKTWPLLKFDRLPPVVIIRLFLMVWGWGLMLRKTVNVFFFSSPYGGADSSSSCHFDMCSLKI
jgi:hypothetical protein